MTFRSHEKGKHPRGWDERRRVAGKYRLTQQPDSGAAEMERKHLVHSSRGICYVIAVVCAAALGPAYIRTFRHRRTFIFTPIACRTTLAAWRSWLSMRIRSALTTSRRRLTRNATRSRPGSFRTQRSGSMGTRFNWTAMATCRSSQVNQRALAV